MSHPVPPQQPPADAARSDAPPIPPVDRPLPEFLPHVPPPGPHSGIEREIERSERASAALAASRALARAAFTDSQLAAEDAAVDDDDIDTSGWIRTEYAALEHPVRDPRDDAARTAAATRNLVGGSFNPGIASMDGRGFPGASPGQAPIRTRTGAQARFLQESRQTPRPGRGIAAGAPGPVARDKPAGMPMSAPATSPVSRKAASAPRARPAAGEPFKFLLAAGVGAMVVLMFGGVAWQAGWLSRMSASNADLVTARVAAQAEAARALSVPPRDAAMAPGAGATFSRTDAEVDAALAAAARAAAVPMASVHAAAPAFAPAAAPVVPAALPPAAASPARRATAGKNGVAEAIVRAQARADHFLASGSGGATAPAAVTDVKPQ